MIKKDSSRGFSVMIALLIVLILAAIGIGGYFVWQKNKDNNAKKSNANTSQNVPKKQDGDKNTKPVDQYQGWQNYSNATYGVSFKYPAEWKVAEGSFDSSGSATKQEYEINLKRAEEVKYNGTASIEILGQDLDTTAAWYDSLSQSQAQKITRTTNTLKDRRSVQYVIANTGAERKIYLFDMGDKTYVFSSIHEEMSIQSDPNYWTKFSKVFDSLELN